MLRYLARIGASYKLETPVLSGQAYERQDHANDYNQTDNIDNAVHFSLHLFRSIPSDTSSCYDGLTRRPLERSIRKFKNERFSGLMGDNKEPRHLHAKMVKGLILRYFSEKSRLGENLKNGRSDRT
ncbi:hypothetical protein ACTJK5_06765 [Agrobacterium sp. 22094]|uniref:hypothetical protein n=1 Tax=Agrobacterium sp. 22094 TaxID=3453872 RepID=UPI003F84B7BD